MNHVFRTDLVVRGYECGPASTVGLPVVLSYLEHCRWQWILDPDLGLVDELRRGSFFVVHRATLALCRGFGIGTALTVRAALRSVSRVSCEVEQDLVRDDGVLLARAQLTAVWLGANGALRRVPDPTRQAVTDAPLTATVAPPSSGGGSFLSPPEPTFDGPVERLVAREVPGDADERPVTVRLSDCDLHAHLNNAAWLRLFEDALGEPVAAADVEYRGQAGPGDTLQLRSWPHPAGRAFAAARGDDVLCRAVLRPGR
ncbi:MAG: acyl-[acyl-carrier-protein] thioesterase [Myxococcota bacterium]